MQKSNQPNEEGKPAQKKTNNRYLDIGWRMLAIVLVGTFAGWFLDRQFPAIKPWGTLSLSVLSVVGSMYIIIKEVSKK